jgi:hypothetical protein
MKPPISNSQANSIYVAGCIVAILVVVPVLGGISSSPLTPAQQEEIRKAEERDARVDKLINDNGALPPIPKPNYCTSQPGSVTPSPTPSRSSSTIETQSDQKFVRQRNQSKAEAIALYPQVADDKTPLGREVHWLIESYKASGDPILYAANAPMLITQVAARKLGIAALKSSKVAASEAEEPPAPIKPYQGPLTRSTASQIEGARLLKEAAQTIAERQQQNHQIVVAPLPSEDWKFKLPSEIEAEKKAAKAAEIAARKKYCEEHPIECEAQTTAQHAQMQAEEVKRDLDSLKTELWLEGHDR